jgi:hypothetical protein
MPVRDSVLPLFFQVTFHPAAKRGVKLRQIANLHGACIGAIFGLRPKFPQLRRTGRRLPSGHHPPEVKTLGWNV